MDGFRLSLYEPPTFRRSPETASPEEYAKLVEAALTYTLSKERISEKFLKKIVEEKDQGCAFNSLLFELYSESLREALSELEDSTVLVKRLRQLNPPEVSLETYHRWLTFYLKVEMESQDAENNYFLEMVTPDDEEKLIALKVEFEFSRFRAIKVRDGLHKEIERLSISGGHRRLPALGLTTSVLLDLDLFDLVNFIADFE